MATRRSFRGRLEKAVRHGRLTTADLQQWFDRPYATVRGWLTNPHHYEPWGPGGTEALRVLTILENAINRRRGFPVPIELSPIRRREYVKRMRHELDRRLSVARAAQ